MNPGEDSPNDDSSLCLVEFKQSTPIPEHRRLTFWSLLAFALAFWLWGDQDSSFLAFAGFIVGYGYCAVRMSLKAQHLFGKDVSVSDALTKEGL